MLCRLNTGVFPKKNTANIAFFPVNCCDFHFEHPFVPDISTLKPDIAAVFCFTIERNMCVVVVTIVKTTRRLLYTWCYFEVNLCTLIFKDFTEVHETKATSLYMDETWTPVTYLNHINLQKSIRKKMYNKFFVQSDFLTTFSKKRMYCIRQSFTQKVFLSEQVHEKFSTFQMLFSFGQQHYIFKVFRTQWSVSVLGRFIFGQSVLFTRVLSKLNWLFSYIWKVWPLIRCE